MYSNQKSSNFIIILAIILSAFSFTISAGTISGIVVDANDSTAMGQCTIKLLSARDNNFIAGGATEDNGSFKLTGINPGRYVLQCSYIGYDNLEKRVILSKSTPNLNVGKIAMGENTIMLKETVVMGKKTEIKVKEDTIEYNADSYKTQPNAVMEDLLKRLPGVEVSSDGKITAQGKEITKILVDGKEFFSDDPKVASKNLPTNIIDKLQVVDKKSDLAQLTGVDDGEDETVINLTIKKGMNNGWFGNVTGGYGTDNRYQGNAMINKFWNGNQITFLGGANNVNSLGFTNGNAARFRQFGGSNGITTSQNFGINFNVGKGDSFRVGGDVMYSHSDNDSRSRLNRQYLFPDSVSYYNSETKSRDKGHSIRGDFRMKWDIDSLNTVEFRPNFSYNINNSLKNDTSSTSAGDAMRTLINSSKNFNTSDGHSFEFGGELVYNHKFKQKKGRSFSLQLKYNLSNVNEDQNAYSKNIFYLNDSTNIRNQYIDNHTWSNTVKGRATWTEPLGDVTKGNFLVFAYGMQYKWSNADKLVYNKKIPNEAASDIDENPYNISYNLIDNIAKTWGPAVYYDKMLVENLLASEDELDSELSNSFRNEFFTQRFQVGYQKVNKKYNLDLGISLTPSMSKSINLTNEAKTIPTRWVWNVAPYLRFRYKMSKQNSFQANYRAKSSQPSMTQLQPVVDNSNPLRVVVGNPNLNPSFSNNIDLRYNNYNIEHQRSIMAMARGTFTSNSIISKTAYNPETGGQLTTYENINGVWNVMGMGMISFPFRNKNWQFTNHLFGRYNVNKGYINGNFNRSNSLSINESAGISFRTDVFEIEARPLYGLQYTTNTVQGQSTPLIHTYGGNMYVNYYLPFGVTLNSDLTYSDTKGYSNGYNSSQWLWNASISYQFLRGKVATVAAQAFDILNQKQNISRNVTANYIQDQEYNNLTRYFMLTFSYRFSTFSGGKNPQSQYQDFNRREHGGPGGGPGRRH